MSASRSGFQVGRADAPAARWGSRRLEVTGILQRIVDAGLFAIICLAPYFMGGRHPVGRVVYLGLIVGTAAAWLLSRACETQQGWRPSSAQWLLLAAVVLLVVQLLPLPTSLLGKLSPKQAELLPIWSAGSDAKLGLGEWSCLSLYPGATQRGLVSLMMFGVLFLLVVQRVAGLDDIERLLRWLGISAVAMAVVGIVQYLSGTGKYLWIYQHPYRSANANLMGAFINRNHFTHFIALGVAPLAWWTAVSLRGLGQQGRSGKNTKQVRWGILPSLLAAGLGMVVLAGLLSLSRGGALALMLALGVGEFVFWRAKLLDWKFLLTALGVTAALAVALALYGYSGDRLDDLASGSLERLDPEGYRRGLWQACVAAIRDFPLVGAGVGTHPELYPAYFDTAADLEFVFAESGYLQVGQEAGAAGLVLLGCALVLVVGWCLGALFRGRSNRAFAAAGAVTAGLVASVVHSFVDFVWYLPACLSLTVVLAACALRLYQLAEPPEQQPRPVRVPRLAWSIAAVVVLVAGVGLVLVHARHAVGYLSWEDYLRTSRIASGNHFTEMQKRKLGAEEFVDAEWDRANCCIVDQLRQVVERDPGHARGHLRLAGVLLKLFAMRQQTAANRMELVEIRDAAMASKFSSREALDEWLSRAVGENSQLLGEALWHTRRALQLCPLQGVGYAYLAQLGFLDGADDMSQKNCLDQALRLRPYDAVVLCEVGRESLKRTPRICKGELPGTMPLYLAGGPVMSTTLAGAAAWVMPAIAPSASSAAAASCEDSARPLAGLSSRPVRPGQLRWNVDLRMPLAEQELELGLGCWRESIRRSDECRLQIVRAVAGRLHVDYIIEKLRPDAAAAHDLYKRLGELNAVEQQTRMREYYLAALEADASENHGRTAALRLLEAHRMLRDAGDFARAEHMIARALQAAPNDFDIRTSSGIWYLKRGQFEAAEKHLRWCALRAPNDANLANHLREAVTGALRTAQEPGAREVQR